MTSRRIIHVDMDAFYASVEQHDNPELRGRPVIVGGLGNRGVVSAASYEAREFGVRSAMPTREARRRCPDGVFVRGRMDRYREVSREVFACFDEITPLVQGLSLDEAFLDVTADARREGGLEPIGRRLRERIRERTGLVASVGMASNKFLAKLASDIDKPAGFRHIRDEEAGSILAPLPVERLWGVGPRTGAALRSHRIDTIGSLREAPRALLEAVLGRDTERIRRLARGIDDRPVRADSDDKSVSNEETWATDIADPDRLRERITLLSEKVAARLRRKQLRGRTVTLKLRTAAFRTHTRSRSFDPPTDRGDVIRDLARGLLDDWLAERPGTALRLIGVGISGLDHGAAQLGLFDVRPAHADRLMDRATGRFGENALRRGISRPSGDSDR